MNPEPLRKRQQELGWKEYRIAQEIDKIRGGNKGANNYTKAVSKILSNPNSSSCKTLQDTVTALGGELIIRWSDRKTIIESHKEVKLT